MSPPGRIASGIGLAVAALGIVLVFVPGLATPLTTSDIVVVALGLVALGVALRALVEGFTERPGSIQTPSPEYRGDVRIPGTSFDQSLAALDPDLRDRLEATCVTMLERFSGVTPDEASDRLAAGTWTDDEDAAAFFAADVHAGEGWLPRWLGEPTVIRQARAVVAALETTARTTGSLETDETGTADGLSTDEGLAGRPRASTSRDRASGAGRDDEAGHARSGETDGAFPRPGTVHDRRTGRWRGVTALALLTVGVGVVTGHSSLLLVGVVGVGLGAFAAYGRAGTHEALELAVDRVVETDRPARGDTVRITVTVRNEGDRFHPDLRVLDGVPPNLVVVDGSPRHAAALRPGEATRFTYSVRAEHGAHEFQPAMVIGRDLTGERERATRVDEPEPAFTCRPSPSVSERVTLRSKTSNYAGQLAAETGGSGLEFHATRDYHPSDPLSSIDWKRLAQHGQLAAIEFREERMAKVVLVVDARPVAHVAPTLNERSALARGVEAADVLVHALLDANHRVGLAALTAHPDPCWLTPGSGTDHRVRARELLLGHPALSLPLPDDPFVPTVGFRRLRRQLPTDSQVVFVTPLCDDAAVDFVRTLEAVETPVTVVSPDPTGAATPGQRLAALERHARLATLRNSRVPVHDWRVDEPLELALAREQRGAQS